MKQSLSVLIREFMKNEDWTNEEFAKRLGVSTRKFKRTLYKEAAPLDAELEKIAEVTAIPIETLMDSIISEYAENAPQMDNAKIGERVACLRKRNGFTQTDLAWHIGISYRTLQEIETDLRQIDVNVLFRLANFFRVSSDYLLGITNDRLGEYLTLESLQQIKNKSEKD